MTSSECLENDITSNISKNSLEVFSRYEVILGKAKKHFAANPKGRCYHLQFVRFCLSLHAKRLSACKELQDVLVLPNESTLVIYKNVFKRNPGIHKGKIPGVPKKSTLV